MIWSQFLTEDMSLGLGVEMWGSNWYSGRRILRIVDCSL